MNVENTEAPVAVETEATEAPAADVSAEATEAPVAVEAEPTEAPVAAEAPTTAPSEAPEETKQSSYFWLIPAILILLILIGLFLFSRKNKK